MAETAKKVEEMKNIMYNTNMLFTDITKQFDKLTHLRSKNKETLDKLSVYKNKGLNIDNQSMEGVTQNEASIYQTQHNLLAKLRETYKTVSHITNDLHEAVRTHADCDKPKTIKISRRTVSIIH